MTDLQGGRTGDPELQALGPWFHNLHLPDGRQTAADHPLGDFPGALWAALAPAIASDLRGRSVLDIGCNAGFYSFELARRGADVLALDTDERYLRQARWACSRYGLGDRIRFERRSVYRLHDLRRRFDLVVFMGVLYHLRHPLLALDQVRECCSDQLLFQSLSLPEEQVAPAPANVPPDRIDLLLQPGWPRLAFVEHAFAADATNWWVPNRAALEAMLRSSGFVVRQRLHTNSWLCAIDESDGAAARARREELQAASGASLS